MDITKALEHGWPHTEWSCGETYESIVFHEGKKPTETEVKNAWDAYKQKRDDNAYIEARAKEYPNVGDQLDAIMKWVAGENEITVTPELKSIAMQCMSVKAKYPKPDVDKKS